VRLKDRAAWGCRDRSDAGFPNSCSADSPLPSRDALHAGRLFDADRHAAGSAEREQGDGLSAYQISQRVVVRSDAVVLVSMEIEANAVEVCARRRTDPIKRLAQHGQQGRVVDIKVCPQARDFHFALIHRATIVFPNDILEQSGKPVRGQCWFDQSRGQGDRRRWRRPAVTAVPARRDSVAALRGHHFSEFSGS
jgi:hypothetical protein